MDGGKTAGWAEVQADDVGDALVAGFAAGGVDHLFFTSGSEIGFFQEATAKARARGANNPIRLITVPHEHASLNAALGFAAVEIAVADFAHELRGDDGGAGGRVDLAGVVLLDDLD